MNNATHSNTNLPVKSTHNPAPPYAGDVEEGSMLVLKYVLPLATTMKHPAGLLAQIPDVR